MNDDKRKEQLFLLGMETYHQGNYFDAHEHWEELWSDFQLEDKTFIQGLIQLAVSFVHLQNGNMIGANSLLNKCRGKFTDYHGLHRNINIDKLKRELHIINKQYQTMNDPSEFNWDIVPELI